MDSTVELSERMGQETDANERKQRHRKRPVNILTWTVRNKIPVERNRYQFFL